MPAPLSNKERRKIQTIERHMELLRRAIEHPVSPQQLSFDRELLGALKWVSEWVRTHNSHHHPQPSQPRSTHASAESKPSEPRIRW